MKKNLLGWFAMATMLVGTGCSSDEVVNDYSPENAIQFGTYVGRDAESRGSVLDNNTTTGLPNQGFGVYAYYTDNGDFNSSTSTPNFMKNTQVKSNNGTDWTYSPVKYWPNESTDKLSFFAYAPWDEYHTLKDVTGDPVYTFTVPTDVTDHIDFVVADATNKKNLTKQNIDEKVVFSFKHVLSRVGFKVEAVIDEVNSENNGADDNDDENKPITSGTTISVQEVELFGNFHTTADINMNTSTWSNHTNTTDSYILNYGDFVQTVADEVTTTAEQLNTDSEYMMLIPHATMAIKVRVKYTVTTADGNLQGGKSEVINNITSEEFAFTFDQGKAYNFVLHLGLTSVKLSADVTEWDPATNHVVNVPLN